MSFLRRIFGTDAPEPEPTMTVTAETTDLEAADGMVIEQLRQSGADLSLPREVIHYLDPPTEDAATARRLFTQLAVATSGDYDGWEAAATP